MSAAGARSRLLPVPPPPPPPARFGFRFRAPRRTVQLRLTMLYVGLFLASAACLLVVTYFLVAQQLAQNRVMPVAAFVINRTLLRDPRGFRRSCGAAAKRHGWEPWFAETGEAEGGLAVTRRAVAAGAGLVFAAGGDGTVRACAEALAGTGAPLAIVPLGTANLTARQVDGEIVAPGRTLGVSVGPDALTVRQPR